MQSQQHELGSGSWSGDADVPIERFDGRTRSPLIRVARHRRHLLPERRDRHATRTHRILSAAVIERDRVCQVCGLPGTPDDPLTAGHKRSRADGGHLVMANLQAEHRTCNSSRGTTR